ncbi:MAG: HNH endonuclease signature motif containing protein [Candidatus Tenebribacter davisii]|nr:HNH endonuclease signature motif containing protein [Candidatus Tenebribacter davisii]
MKESKLTYAELHRQLSYNSFTGLFRWKVVRPKSRSKIGGILKYTQFSYVRIKINGKSYQAHRLAWLYVHGKWPEGDIDHKDQVRYHNWIDNLRETNTKYNGRNRGNPKNNISGVKGVYWNKIAINGYHR